MPLNAPPYDPAQWGWGPRDRFYVTRSYYGFAKDYPGVHPYRVVPPGAGPCQTCGSPPCASCGPAAVPTWTGRMPMPGPMVVGPNPPIPNLAAPNSGPNVASGPTAVAF